MNRKRDSCLNPRSFSHPSHPARPAPPPPCMKVPLRCQVDAISFSAHADFSQTSEFCDLLQPPHIVLVHGEATGEGGRSGFFFGNFLVERINVINKKTKKLNRGSCLNSFDIIFC